MKHRHLIAGAILVAGGVSAGAALAQGPMGGPGMGMHQRPAFEDLDADGDGQVTQAEMLAHAQARFGAADADGDGRLSLEEMQAQARARADEMAARMLERMDRDGDGALSFDEMPGQRRESGMERMFGRADADGDGSLSAEEFQRAGARMGRHHHGDGRGRMAQPGGKHGMMGGQGRMGDCDGPMRQRMQGDN